MKDYKYIYEFEKMGLGLFVHFGLYSIVGSGEWGMVLNPKIKKEEYDNLPAKFKVAKNWAKDIVKTAGDAGARYITITTRHHDGFSLYDTNGLSSYDAVHSACGRDLIKEFVTECRKAGIKPFFYHTLLDWHRKEYNYDFDAYIDYLIKSIELLCVNYGEIGGFWFDGMWDKPNENWQEDRIYAVIRKYQPNAMIINNTGLSSQGKVGHREIDSVTFERGRPNKVDNSDRPRAGEMCQVLNDHWGYVENDVCYKSVQSLICDLADCRANNCNFLLNIGPKGNGKIRAIDAEIIKLIGKWIKINKNFIYDVKSTEIKADNAYLLCDGKYYYAVIKNVGMSANPNVTIGECCVRVTVHTKGCLKDAVWLDNMKPIKCCGNSFDIEPFGYGTSLCVRIARFVIE